MAAHRLYGIFWTENGVAMWGLIRNGKRARAYGRHKHALVVSMVAWGSTGAWDAPTFRACADRVEGDWRTS